MYTIRLGAKRSAGHGWVHYDEQFMLRKALNPSSSWAVVNTELWLLYMNNSGKIYGSGGAFNIETLLLAPCFGGDNLRVNETLHMLSMREYTYRIAYGNTHHS
jgi:hypothetical protein